MSHFSIIVCIDGKTPKENIAPTLDEIMAPFDENQPSASRINRSFANTEWMDSFDFKYKYGKPDDQGNYVIETDNLPSVTAQQFVDALNEGGEHWGIEDGNVVEYTTYPDTKSIEISCVGSGNGFMCEYNENHEPHIDQRILSGPKWDWWVVGGRFQRHFALKPNTSLENALFGPNGAFGDNQSSRLSSNFGMMCDGARFGDLDFDIMRNDAEKRAEAKYVLWEIVKNSTPDAEYWKDILKRVDNKEMTIDEARKKYHAQPRVKKFKELVDKWSDMDEFSMTREQYLKIARSGAVPGYALIDLDGLWREPGEMGWFGMSTETQDSKSIFTGAVNNYLSGLSEDIWIVSLDGHI